MSRERNRRSRSRSREKRSRSPSYSYSYSRSRSGSYSSASRSYSGSDYSDYSSYSYDSSSSREPSREHKRTDSRKPQTEGKPKKEKEFYKGPNGEMLEKETANYETTGALGKDRNTGVMYNGVLLKWCEPTDAAKPTLKWRMYEFKDNRIIDTKYLHRCSAFLIGRDERVCDWLMLHESISKQHAVLQFRKVPINPKDRSEFARKAIKPYIMDLGSTNGTYLNGKRIEPNRYYELREGDELKFGYSTRKYILLNENSVDLPDVEEENAVASPVQSD
ncbi:hypothetical protein WA577_007408 [Blastocystis sp. JDR]